MGYDAVVLAGARNTQLTAGELNANYEAMIEVRQRPLITYILQALTKAQRVERIIVVGPKKEEKNLIANGADLVVESKEDIVENIKVGLRGLTQWGSNSLHFLLISSDIPLVTPTALNDFINNCEEVKEDFSLYYPIISKERNLTAYPESKRTYVKLKDGIYTGGNLALLSSEVIENASELINKILVNRKNPLKMSRILGLKFIFKLFFGRLTISEVEDRVSELINNSCKAIITEYPELGFDIDKPEDLKLIRRLVAK